jgi:hypothetical protein
VFVNTMQNYCHQGWQFQKLILSIWCEATIVLKFRSILDFFEHWLVLLDRIVQYCHDLKPFILKQYRLIEFVNSRALFRLSSNRLHRHFGNLYAGDWIARWKHRRNYRICGTLALTSCMAVTFATNQAIRVIASFRIWRQNTTGLFQDVRIVDATSSFRLNDDCAAKCCFFHRCGNENCSMNILNHWP